MPCTQTPVTILSMATTPKPTNAKSFSPLKVQRLYVCDNPEPLDTTTFTTPIITLWSDLASGITSVRYRIFMWHHNESSTATIKYGITVGNGGSNPVSISNIKYETTTTSNNGDILTNAGFCLAKALLGNTLISESSAISVPANSVNTIKEFQLGPNQVRGVIMEFTLSSSSAMTARVRTVAAKSISAALNSHQGAVVPSYGTHPRGTWDYADVNGSNEELIIPNGATISNSVAIFDNTATTNIFPGTTLSNPAGFGGIYKCNFILKNSSGTAQTVNLYLNPRGGKFVGAVKVGSNAVNGVPKVGVGEVAKIGSFTIANGASITVPVQVTTGGGSSTPIAFFIAKA